MSHGFEACKTCQNRFDLCKNTRIKNCREIPQQDMLRRYVKEKSIIDMFNEMLFFKSLQFKSSEKESLI